MPVPPEPCDDYAWFKSSYSGANTTECVEAVFVTPGVLIRDSKQPAGPRLALSPAAWAAFLGTARETRTP